MKTHTEYRNQWRAADRVFPSAPLHIDLELSTACNLKCGFCFLQNPKYKKPPVKFLPTEKARKLITLFADAGVCAMKFNWRGEATLHPHFNEIAFHANAKFNELLLNTNGQFSDEKFTGLDFFNRVAFSVDSFAPHIYKSIRGGNVERLIQNIKVATRSGFYDVELRRVICEKNKHEAFRVEANKLFPGVKVDEHFVFDRANFKAKKLPRKFCGQPNRRLVVSTNGDVFPCCVDYSGQLKLGNIYKDSLSVLWRRSLSLAVQLQRGAWPKACLQCSSYTSYDCKESECLNR